MAENVQIIELANEAPWYARALELETKEGPYCFYSAWEGWMDKHAAGVLDDMSHIDRVELYSLFEKCAEETRIGEVRP